MTYATLPPPRITLKCVKLKNPPKGKQNQQEAGRDGDSVGGEHWPSLPGTVQFNLRYIMPGPTGDHESRVVMEDSLRRLILLKLLGSL